MPTPKHKPITLSMSAADQVLVTRLARAMREQTGADFSTPSAVLRWALNIAGSVVLTPPPTAS